LTVERFERVRVLYITAELPFPLTSGFLRHYHFLRGLGRRHRVTHISLTQQTEVPPETLAALGAFSERIVTVSTREADRARQAALRRFPSGRRLEAAFRRRVAVAELRRTVQKLVETESFDVVLFSGKITYPVIAALEGLPIVADCCDAASARTAGELRHAPPARRAELLVRYLVSRRTEHRLLQKTQHLAFASVRDRDAMVGDATGGTIVPNGVDVGYWQRRTPSPNRNRIVFHGVMSYPPNHDAALVLVKEIFPRVCETLPEAELVIAGRDPLPELREAASRQGATVTGAVEDMRGELTAADVYVAPLRFASGIQNKLLEALAMELPVITTPAAAGGLLVDGSEPPLLVEDDDDAVAATIVRLLRAESERIRIGRAGRRFVEEHFQWERSIERLEALCLEACDGRRGESAHARRPASLSAQ
jgi:polysaccharide biosynthesis protein PslH